MEIQNSDESLLFKFTPINLNLIKLLINSEIWFSSLYKLNDPFEIEFAMERMNELPNDEFLMEWYLNKSSYKHNENKAKWLINKIKKDSSLFYKDLKNDLRIQYHNKLKVACFSLIYNEILLWSHYADEHKGICLIFDKDILIVDAKNEMSHPRLDFVNAQNVKYGFPQKLKVKFEHEKFRLPIRNLRASNFKKLKCWRYEKEYRIVYKDVFDTIPNGISSAFTKKALRGVMFGEKCSIDDIRLVYSILDKYEYVDSNFSWGASKIAPSTGKLISIQEYGEILVEDFIWRRNEWLYHTHY